MLFSALVVCVVGCLMRVRCLVVVPVKVNVCGNPGAIDPWNISRIPKSNTESPAPLSPVSVFFVVQKDWDASDDVAMVKNQLSNVVDHFNKVSRLENVVLLIFQGGNAGTNVVKDAFDEVVVQGSNFDLKLLKNLTDKGTKPTCFYAQSRIVQLLRYSIPKKTPDRAAFIFLLGSPNTTFLKGCPTKELADVKKNLDSWENAAKPNVGFGFMDIQTCSGKPKQLKGSHYLMCSKNDKQANNSLWRLQRMVENKLIQRVKNTKNCVPIIPCQRNQEKSCTQTSKNECVKQTKEVTYEQAFEKLKPRIKKICSANEPCSQTECLLSSTSKSSTNQTQSSITGNASVSDSTVNDTQETSFGDNYTQLSRVETAKPNNTTTRTTSKKPRTPIATLSPVERISIIEGKGTTVNRTMRELGNETTPSNILYFVTEGTGNKNKKKSHMWYWVIPLIIIGCVVVIIIIAAVIMRKRKGKVDEKPKDLIEVVVAEQKVKVKQEADKVEKTQSSAPSSPKISSVSSIEVTQDDSSAKEEGSDYPEKLPGFLSESETITPAASLSAPRITSNSLSSEQQTQETGTKTKDGDAKESDATSEAYMQLDRL